MNHNLKIKTMSNKKETTLEDAAEKLARAFDNDNYKALMDLVIDGAEWQAEKMYSDIELFTEELKDKIDSFEYSVNQNSYISDYIKEWFEKFKNQNNEQ
jgi:hypothetical protein